MQQSFTCFSVPSLWSCRDGPYSVVSSPIILRWLVQENFLGLSVKSLISPLQQGSPWEDRFHSVYHCSKHSGYKELPLTSCKAFQEGAHVGPSPPWPRGECAGNSGCALHYVMVGNKDSFGSSHKLLFCCAVFCACNNDYLQLGDFFQ